MEEISGNFPPDSCRFITTYNTLLPNLNQILANLDNILNPSENLVKINLPKGIYKRSKNLSDDLVSARIGKPKNNEMVHGCTTCNAKICQVSKVMRSISTIKSPRGIDFHIHHIYDCNSKNIIYLLQCSHCKKNYIGETRTTFKERYRSHKWQAKKVGYPLNDHLIETGHTFADFETMILKGDFENDVERLKFEAGLIHFFNAKKLGLNKEYGTN
jgi:hypothetical protein